jgi:hypothetical protein
VPRARVDVAEAAAHGVEAVRAFGRDRGRFADARRRLNESPLGAAALAGTSFPIDRKATAKALGFERPMANSLDAVSARDFALEFLAAHNIGSSGFWDWVGIKELTAYDSTKWYPDQHWFWWRETRMLDGGRGIHEFPFFSFLLGDLHPHVMSIPFVLLAGGALALEAGDHDLTIADGGVADDGGEQVVQLLV